MKSQTFKEFFEKFKEQSTCLICGRPLYIKTMSKFDNQHMSKTCYKHIFHVLTQSVEIKKDLVVFDKDGYLLAVNNQQFNKIDISNLCEKYNEKSFMNFIQNLKVLL